MDFKRLLDTKHEYEKDLSLCQSIDYETKNSVNYEWAVRPFHKHTKIFSYCIGHPEGNVEVYRLDNKNRQENFNNFNRLKNFWADTSIRKVSHNSKFEIAMTLQAGIDIPENSIIHDTMIESQMLRNLSPRHGLAWLCYELNDTQEYEYHGKKFNSQELDKYVAAEGKRLRGYDKIDKELMYIYQVADGQRPLLLHSIFFKDIISKEKLYKDYLNELDLIRVTYYMEKEGLYIDRDKCNELLNWLSEELKKLPYETEKELRYFVNLGSDKSVSHILFNQLQLPVIEFTDKGQPSTDKDTIIALKEMRPDLKILDLILKHRSYTKGHANITSYLEFAGENDFIHPNIRTNGAHKTGRQSSSDPNLQNIEKDSGTKNLYPVPARQCFFVHPECVTISIDYSAIELRLILEAAQSKKMMDNLRNGISPHVVFCKFFYGPHVPIEKQFKSKKESKELYDSGKNGHFCLCYGGALKKLAQTLVLSIDETKVGKDLYKKEYPEIADLVKNGIDKISGIGYVETPFGRKLWIERDKLYGWLNYYIQGTAAGILKRAEVKIHHYLKTQWKNSGIALIMCIHDELLIKFPRNMLKYRNEVLKDIALLMTTMPEIAVPLEVEAKYTKTSWAETLPLQIG